MATPPIGVYQVGEESPDKMCMATDDERIQTWLTSRNIDYTTVYRVRLFDLGAWVFRYATQDGRRHKNLIFDEAERRLPLWVWQ